MLRIRRNILFAAAVSLAASVCMAGSAHARELKIAAASPPDPAAERARAASALRMLLRPAVMASIAEWGVSPQELADDVGRLGTGDIARVVDAAGRLTWRDWQRSARYQAMYLVLVAEVRQSLLHARVLSRFRSAGTALPEVAPVLDSTQR